MTDITSQVSLDTIRQSFETRHEKTNMSPVAEFAVSTLKKYAHQTGNMLRGTSDISPLEEWLIRQLFEKEGAGCKKRCDNIVSQIDKI